MTDEGTAAPTVSVCIPTYNYARFLPRTIGSVLDQTYDDLEVIVVDDASTDDTDEVMERYADDPRVSYVKNDPNLGLFKNFNHCASLARGRYLKFLCADDWLDPRYLERTVPLLEADQRIGLVTNSHVLTDVDENPVTIEYAPFGGRDRIPSQDAVDMLIRWHYPLGRPTNVVIRRELFDRVGGFDGDFAPTGDLQLWLRLLGEADLGAVREPLCFVRAHETKTHAFANDPTAMVFTVWRDAAAREGGLVDERRLRKALAREGVRCTVFAVDAALHGDFAQAKHVMSYVWANVPRATFPFIFLGHVPRIARNFVTRMLAVRKRRFLLIEPNAKLGPPLSSGIPR
ncbi:MAG: glycosyltransferase family 2 protein [Solirubrobacterales bacterium]